MSLLCGSLSMVLFMGSVFLCQADVEPNNGTANAEPLAEKYEMSGTISPVGDLDYYALSGINQGWGYVALLDTSSSSNSSSGGLVGFASDGMTSLQSDSGSWEKGSVLALQSYADGSATHYLRVQEVPGSDIITPYTLTFYNTIVSTQPEQEPNDSLGTANSTGMTMTGTIGTNGDVDCYSFHGTAGDSLIVALNGDPENDGSPSDLVLSLLDHNSTVITSVNFSVSGGNEVIVVPALPSTGVYAYRVHANSGYGSTATYKVGLLVRGGLYFPPYSQDITWLNKPANGKARVGDLLNFQLMMRNDAQVVFPGDINLGMTYPTQQFEFVQSSMGTSSSSPGNLYFYGLKTGLAVGESYTIDVQLRAISTGDVTVRQTTGMPYFFTGVAFPLNVQIEGGGSGSAIELLLLE